MGEWHGIELVGLELGDDQLLLRPWAEADAARVHRAMQHRSMHEFLSLPDPYTEADARDFTGSVTGRQRESGAGFEAAVVERSSGELVGAAGVTLPVERDTGGEIGYAVYPWGRGHGHATRAAQILAGWALRHGAARMQIRSAVGNVASVRCALAAGFRFEGIGRAGVLTPSGPADAAVFGRTAGDDGQPTSPFFPPLRALRDGTVRLRPVGPADAAARQDEHDNPAARQWAFTDEPFSTAQAVASTQRAGLEWLVGPAAQIAIVDEQSDEVAGFVDLRRPGPPGVALVGYGVRPAFRGRGLTSRALRLLREWAFTDGGLHCLELGAKVDNIASRKAAEGGGFISERVAYSRLRNPDGTFSDEARFYAVE